MSFNRYFHDELSSLRELGKEFSLKNPRLAPFLAEEAQDPDVERLLEGVAFLTGRLRQKLDDELPEVTHSLMALLWPNFLRPVPAMSVLEFNPIISLSEAQTVAKGTEVESKPVDNTPCTFRTCYDVDINPLEVASVTKFDRPQGSRLQVKLTLTSSLSPEELGLEKLRFFLHGEVHVAQTLYLWLFRYLDQVNIKAVGHEGREFNIPQSTALKVSPVGFADNENLLPVDPQLFKGYRLIQEYFALPEKFHFFELEGLDCIAEYAARNEDLQYPQELILEFEFNRAFESHINVTNDAFRLHCTPVINLLSHSAAPIHLDHRKTDYRVVPDGQQPDHYEIFSIDKVEGWGYDSRKYHQYSRFESYEHARTVDIDSQGRYFRERLSSSMSGYGVDTHLAFVNAAEHSVVPEVESLSIDITCSNRHLPSMLSVGDINTATGTSPEYASFTNIIPVTPSFTPPLDQGFHWRLIANMSLNYTTLCSLDAIKTILSTYDYRSFYDRQLARASQHRIDGLDEIHTEPCERLYQGLPVRGMKTKLKVRESAFSNEGDMFVFLTVLSEFFALYASMNSFHHLEVLGLENGEVYQWTPRLGQQPLI